MASLPGAIFDEYSTLSTPEKTLAAASVGNNVSFSHIFSLGGLSGSGTDGNDVFLVNNGATGIQNTGGIDVVVSSASYKLGEGIEHLILTGATSLIGRGNGLNNVITGNDGNNLLDGGGGDDLLLGGAGSDVLYGRSGRDTLEGGNGDDILIGGNGDGSLSGGSGNDSIEAGDGNDVISGGADNDAIFGNAGNDTISGGSGNDVILGGAGADIFLFSAADAGTTTILDFTAGVDFIAVHEDTSINNVLATVSHNGEGDAILTLDGKIIILAGVDEQDVTAGFFHII